MWSPLALLFMSSWCRSLAFPTFLTQIFLKSDSSHPNVRVRGRYSTDHPGVWLDMTLFWGDTDNPILVVSCSLCPCSHVSLQTPCGVSRAAMSIVHTFRPHGFSSSLKSVGTVLKPHPETNPSSGILPASSLPL